VGGGNAVETAAAPPSFKIWRRVSMLLRCYPNFRVRREKAPVHSGCKSHPGTGSLHPVAIGAVVEETKLLKPPV